jgi:hypothetical protein
MKTITKFLKVTLVGGLLVVLPGLGEPVAVTQSYQGRDGDAATDRQVTSAVVRT